MDNRKKTVAEALGARTSLPLIVGPMFLVSNADLVIAACTEGIVGTFPAASTWTSDAFEEWLKQVTGALDDFSQKNPARTVAPFSVNLKAQKQSPRQLADIALCEKYKVPVVHLSDEAAPEIVKRIQAYGGIVLQDAKTADEARRAVAAGVDGIVAVTSGAGGQAGTLNPFVLLGEIRAFYDGFIALAGGMADGRDIAAAQAMGADFVLMGTRFIATVESAAAPAYKKMVVDAQAEDIIYTSAISGAPGNFIRQSMEGMGYDSADIKKRGPGADKIPTPPGEENRAWKYVWSAGQAAGRINDIPSVQDLAARMKKEYAAARMTLSKTFGRAAKKRRSAANKPQPKNGKPPSSSHR